MEGVVERGTAQKLKVLQRPIAGKTGTTNDEKDAWFIGFTPDLVVGVYMGFDNPAPLGHGETGGNVSAPVVRDFFKLALADQPPVAFRVPSDIRLVRVNLKTGLPTGPNDPKAILEAFKPNEGPAGTADETSNGEPESVPEEALGQDSAETANTSALGLTAPNPPAPHAAQSLPPRHSNRRCRIQTRQWRRGVLPRQLRRALSLLASSGLSVGSCGGCAGA